MPSRTSPWTTSGRVAACTSLALTMAVGATTSAVAADAPAALAAERPDIVTIYLDDVAPHDGRLWNDPARTPALARLFADGGVTFTNAIGETPLCSPGRAGTLTGRHTANHGVDANVVGDFEPAVTIGTELQDVGYRTLYVGKYLNGLRSEVPRSRVKDYAVGWDEFDVLYEDQGRYRDYVLWTRDGVRWPSLDRQGHSTVMTKRRIRAHLRDTAPGQPLFAFVSLYDLHAPNRPAQRYRGDKRCRDIEPWKPPSFNEDVSDKPDYVQRRRPIARDGWPLRRYCEQMLAVDEVVRTIVREQRRRGRLDDTLFVFTADNGATWGTQRLPQRKGVPYATPIPLMLSWPARWGIEARSIDELVSNIDLAPTLCEVAGCEMGPYVDGPPQADGLSLLPLLDGEAEHLDRTLVREQSGPGYPWAPEFWAVRTSDEHELGRWHYIEYETGEAELYDAEADPWELENRAFDPAFADTVNQLAAELRLEFPDLPTAEAAPRAG